MVDFNFRNANSSDSFFLEYTYVLTQKPLLKKFDGFDDQIFLDRFKEMVKLGEVKIIVTDHRDIGWMQITDKKNVVELAQIHLLEAYRNQSIGSIIIRQVQKGAAALGKAVTLAVIKGNPALALYKRLGFEIVREDDKKHYMIWTLGR